MAKTEEKTRYSYIKKPWSINGWYTSAIALITLVLTAFSAASMLRTHGNVNATTAALGITCILLDIMGMVFAGIGLRETDKKLTFVRIGGVVCSLLLILWLIITAIGAGGL